MWLVNRMISNLVGQPSIVTAKSRQFRLFLHSAVQCNNGCHCTFFSISVSCWSSNSMWVLNISISNPKALKETVHHPSISAFQPPGLSAIGQTNPFKVCMDPLQVLVGALNALWADGKTMQQFNAMFFENAILHLYHIYNSLWQTGHRESYPHFLFYFPSSSEKIIIYVRRLNSSSLQIDASW